MTIPERSLSTLVLAARVSPVLRDAMHEVEDALRTMDHDWTDLYERLRKAEDSLLEMAEVSRDRTEAKRLRAKAEGVSLAVGYMRGYGT